MKFGFSIERLVEGDHAAIHRAFAKARYHTESFDSLVRRLPEIKEVLSHDDGFEQMCNRLHEARNPRKAVEALGLQGHPSFAQAAYQWDRELRRIVYRSDAVSLYGPRPALEVGPPPPPPPPAADAAAAVPPEQPPAANGPAAAVPPPGLPPDDALALPEDAAAGAAAPAPSHGEVVEAQPPHLVHRPDDAVLDDGFQALLHHHALKFLASQLKALMDLDSKFAFSMPLEAHAVQPLRVLLSMKGQTRAPLERPWWEESGHGRVVGYDGFTTVQGLVTQAAAGTRHGWFKVAFRSPAQAKRAQAGHLQPSDVGICFHRPLLTNHATRQVVIEASPIHTSHALLPHTEPTKTPLVLCASQMSLASLRALSVWRVQPELRYLMDMGGDPPLPLPPDHVRRHEHVVVQQLCSEESFRPDAAQHGIMQLLGHYAEQQLVQHELGIWSLTPAGRQRAVLGNILGDGTRVLAVRDLPLQELSIYELVTKLTSEGWRCVIADKRMSKVARGDPYVHGRSANTWFIRAGATDICKHYLIALMTCHGDPPIPHLASAATYAGILGVETRQRPRKRKCVPLQSLALEDQDLPDTPPPSPEHPRGDRRPRRPLALHDLAPGDAVVPIEDDADDAGSSSDSSDSEDSKSDSGIDIDSSNSGGGDSNAGDDAGDPDGVVVVDEEMPPPAPPSPEVHRIVRNRNPFASIPYGLCRMTPRSGTDGQNAGWQMTCNHPSHSAAASGRSACTKSLSNSVSGSEQLTLRMLQHWVVIGMLAPSKQAHSELWDRVQQAVVDGCLPSSEELDRQRPVAWPALDAASVPACSHAEAVPPPPKRSRDDGFDQPEDRAGGDPLGGPNPGVPPEVHARMLRLLAVGGVPKTTAERRLRYKPTSGTVYGVPGELKEALKYSYIHPDLPAPRGFRWVRLPGGFRLAPLGG